VVFWNFRYRLLAFASIIFTLLAFPGTSHAADLTVNAITAYIATDGQCSLVEAIDNANNDAATHADCPAGNGPDTITLSRDVALDGTTVFTFFGENGLPPITSTITIQGEGFSISRVTGSPAFRIFAVAGGGNLTLSRVTVSGGQQSSGFNDGGGIYTAGVLTLNESTVQNNVVDSIFPSGGGIYGTNASQITLTNTSVQNNIADNGNAAQVFDNGGGVYSDGPLTLLNATVQNNRAAENGGGVYVTNRLTANNSTIANNDAGESGGGLLVFGASPAITITNTTFNGNTAAEFGGAVGTGGDNVTIFGSTFTGNTAGSTGGGGAIHNEGGTITITASNFVGNRALSGAVGGAITNIQLGTVNLVGSIVQGNSSESLGGGLFTQLATFNIFDSLIVGNTARDGGGLTEGASNVAGFTIQRSVIRDNVATRFGGGLYSTSALTTARLYNSTITGNTAALQGGGVMMNGGGQVELAYSTIANNTTTSVANSIGGVNLFAGTGTLRGTIIANNTNGECNATNSSTSQGFNVSLSPAGGFPVDRWCSFIPINASDLPATDPLLAPVANNGGIDVSYTLQGGSPAIDIEPASCPAVLNSVDQRGVPRPAGSCDAGSISSDNVILPQVYFRTPTTRIDDEGTITAPQTVELVIDNTAGNFNTPTTVPLTIYVSQTGTATDAVDYTDSQAGPIQVTFNAGNFPAPGATAVFALQFTVINDELIEPDETIQLQASLTGPGVLDTTRSTHTLTIINDDPNTPLSPTATPIPNSDNTSPNGDTASTGVSAAGSLTINMLGFPEPNGQIRWIITVNNTTGTDLSGVRITSLLPPGLRVVDVETTNGTVAINEQSIAILLETLFTGQPTSITLLTALNNAATLDAVENVGCVSVGPVGEQVCVTAQVISALPQTGEIPVWRRVLLLVIGVISGIVMGSG
jgi:predicted outer membrane repeat protein